MLFDNLKQDKEYKGLQKVHNKIEPEYKFFDIVNAFIRKDKKEAIRLIKKAENVGEPIYKILSILEKELKILLFIKYDGLVSNEIPHWKLKKYTKYSRAYSAIELITIFKLINQMQRDIKNGNLPDINLYNQLITLYFTS